jgi:hypothetical protein
LREHRGELAAPVPVIAEAAWLILDRLGTAAQTAFVWLITAGQFAGKPCTSCHGLSNRGHP